MTRFEPGILHLVYPLVFGLRPGRCRLLCQVLPDPASGWLDPQPLDDVLELRYELNRIRPGCWCSCCRTLPRMTGLRCLATHHERAVTLARIARLPPSNTTASSIRLLDGSSSSSGCSSGCSSALRLVVGAARCFGRGQAAISEPRFISPLMSGAGSSRSASTSSVSGVAVRAAITIGEAGLAADLLSPGVLCCLGPVILGWWCHVCTCNRLWNSGSGTVLMQGIGWHYGLCGQTKRTLRANEQRGRNQHTQKLISRITQRMHLSMAYVHHGVRSAPRRWSA